MKSTGIVRRVDDIGRIFIPKEIRRSLGIEEGDLLELLVDQDENCVCFKRYMSSLEPWYVVQDAAESLRAAGYYKYAGQFNDIVNIMKKENRD